MGAFVMRKTSVFLSLLLLSTMAAAGPNALSKKDVTKLALSQALDLDAVTLNAVAAPGRNADATAFVESLGGRIVYRFDDVDFFSAVVPIERVADVMMRPSVLEFDLEPRANVSEVYGAVRLFNVEDVAAARPIEASASGHPRLQPFPVEAAHTVLDDINAKDWRAANPSFDGRGVVIAHVEGLPDLLAAEMQTAYDLEGRPVRKVIDAVIIPDQHYGLSPADDIRNWRSVHLDAPQSPVHGELTVGGLRYEAPEAGRFQTGVVLIPNKILGHFSPGLADPDTDAMVRSMSERRVPETAKDARHAPKPVPATPFAFAWNASDQTLWFDSDRDGTWRDEVQRRPFGPSGDAIVLGHDDPATPARETAALVFQVSGDGDSLVFDFALFDHATMVAGSAAGSKGEAGRIDGVAPGAQIISIRTSPTATAYARAVIAAFTDPRTDIVLMEGISPVTGSNQLVAGQEVLALLVQRLIEAYDKPVFATAYNAPGMSRISDFCVSADAVCVGAYQSRTTTRLTQGVDMGVEHSLHWVGSSGPSITGAIKPDFLAPSNIVALGSHYRPFQQPAGLYEPVYGYQVGGGTSNAAPVAVGAAALIISAAKQKGWRHGAREINRALRSSARYLEEQSIEAYQQGRGLIDVAAAWSALENQSSGALIAIDVVAPVSTVHSGELRTPNSGVGLFEREGWSVGDRGKRTLTLTRTSGPAKALEFDLALRGDADAFLVPKSVELPLNTRVDIDIGIDVTAPGAHSAMLVLMQSDRADTLAEIGLNIVVPEPLSRDNGWRFEGEVALRPAERRSFFVRVPQGADGLWVSARNGQEAEPISILSPSNWSESSHGFSNDMPYHYTAGVTLPAPAEGVWEILTWNTWSHMRAFDWSLADEVGPRRNIGLDIAVVDADISYDRVKGVAHIENRGAALYGGLATASAASFREKAGRIAPHTHKVFEIEVEPGSEMLVAEIEPISGADLDMDLFLYYCPRTDDCHPLRHARTYSMTERLVVQWPAEGIWKAVLTTYGATGGATKYRYRDYWTHPKFGGLASGDMLVPRGSGEAWSAVLTRRPPRSAPAAGRVMADVLYLNAPQYVSVHTQTAMTKLEDPMLKSPFRKNNSLAPVGLTVIPR